MRKLSETILENFNKVDESEEQTTGALVNESELDIEDEEQEEVDEAGELEDETKLNA